MNITVIFGPQASGKTRNAEKLKSFYRCKRVIDDEFTCAHHANAYTPPHHARLRDRDLILTNDARTADLLRDRNARVIHIADALRAAGVEAP
ncbi:hypothetical protein [Luteimonas notoginsengisoli]|uniref:ATP-binding protein n=1 Tax=Luteimonas notoginsengisoli TaxID=1578200 RepID=A0ABV7UPY3_9GAMM